MVGAGAVTVGTAGPTTDAAGKVVTAGAAVGCPTAEAWARAEVLVGVPDAPPEDGAAGVVEAAPVVAAVGA
ncbi:MAG TPA: hypothetical protein VFH58_02450 [Acidimicrobiales bacterium]|nr:hypothetical protein [Acidimicrobiales bacterium]